MCHYFLDIQYHVPTPLLLGSNLIPFPNTINSISVYLFFQYIYIYIRGVHFLAILDFQKIFWLKSCVFASKSIKKKKKLKFVDLDLYLQDFAFWLLIVWKKRFEILNYLFNDFDAKTQFFSQNVFWKSKIAKKLTPLNCPYT